MYAHFRNAIADGFTIAKIPGFRGTNSGNDPGLANWIAKAPQPRVEFVGSDKGIHEQ